MNKIQYIKLLSIRGVTELEGVSVGIAVKETGGEPTDKEMIETNLQAMTHYINKFTEQKEVSERLRAVNERLQKRDDLLRCLEDAGVDNWDGYNDALEIGGVK